MAEIPTLPGSYGASKGLPDDLDELYDFLAKVTESEFGSVTIAREFLEALTSLPGFEAAEDVLLVRDRDGAITGAELVQHTDPYVNASMRGYVHPERLDQGIGTTLLEWGLTRAKERLHLAPDGVRVVASNATSDSHKPSIALSENFGFELERYFLEMRIDFEQRPPEPSLPEGLELRNYDDDDLEVLYDVVDDAFRDHFGYVERSREEGLERWRTFTSIPGWDNSLVWLAFDGKHAVGGNVCIGFHGDDKSTGYVATLGVRRAWRGRGLAKSMLLVAFNEFHDRGKRGVALHVDAESLTGATRLYESVGMNEVRRHRDYELELRSGQDISVR